MKLADVSIRQPVFATMMIASLMVLGIFSYPKVGVDNFPKVEFPIVTVTAVKKSRAHVDKLRQAVVQ